MKSNTIFYSKIDESFWDEVDKDELEQADAKEDVIDKPQNHKLSMNECLDFYMNDDTEDIIRNSVYPMIYRKFQSLSEHLSFFETKEFYVNIFSYTLIYDVINKKKDYNLVEQYNVNLTEFEIDKNPKIITQTILDLYQQTKEECSGEKCTIYVIFNLCGHLLHCEPKWFPNIVTQFKSLFRLSEIMHDYRSTLDCSKTDTYLKFQDMDNKDEEPKEMCLYGTIESTYDVFRFMKKIGVFDVDTEIESESDEVYSGSKMLMNKIPSAIRKYIYKICTNKAGYDFYVSGFMMDSSDRLCRIILYLDKTENKRLYHTRQIFKYLQSVFADITPVERGSFVERIWNIDIFIVYDKNNPPKTNKTKSIISPTEYAFKDKIVVPNQQNVSISILFVSSEDYYCFQDSQDTNPDTAAYSRWKYQVSEAIKAFDTYKKAVSEITNKIKEIEPK